MMSFNIKLLLTVQKMTDNMFINYIHVIEKLPIAN